MKAPDAAQQFVLGEDAIGVAGQRAEQLELHRAQFDARPGDADLARGGVDLDGPTRCTRRVTPRARRTSAHDGAQMQVAGAGRQGWSLPAS